MLNEYILTIPAVNTPLSLNEVKDYLRIPLLDTTQDDFLTSLINIATIRGEGYTGREFINKTFELYLDYFPYCKKSIQVRKTKLQSITSIEYLVDEVFTVFNASNYYTTKSNEFSNIELVDGQSYPQDVDNRKQAVKITFIAGYGENSSDVPDVLKRAMLADIAYLYENKGDCDDCGSLSMQSQAKQLYSQYRISAMFLR